MSHYGAGEIGETTKDGYCDALQLEVVDVAPVVLGFNYEAHNAPVQQLRKLHGPLCTQLQNFSIIEQATGELWRFNQLIWF